MRIEDKKSRVITVDELLKLASDLDMARTVLNDKTMFCQECDRKLKIKLKGASAKTVKEFTMRRL